MKIAFIHCGVNNDNGTFVPRVDPNWIHHGISSISAYIKSKGYTDVSCINLCRLSHIDEFRALLDTTYRNTDVFAISMMSVDFEVAVDCIDIIKQLQPEAKIVVGGIHATLMTHEVEAVKNIDHIIVGEGEISFGDLLDNLSNNTHVDRLIRGIRPEDLDSLPPVDCDLMGRLESAYMPIMPEPFVSIIAGRGCIYGCKFCQPSEKILFGSRVRRRSVDNVIAELKYLRDRYQFKSVMIHDDCLTEDKQWIKDFCAQYKKHGFDQPFIIQSRVDFICRNEDLVKQLADAGLRLVSIGFESGSQRILNFLSKGTTVEQNIKASEICHKYGIKIKGNFMLGTPSETNEEAQATLEMIKKIRPYRISVTFYTPLPGSYLHDYCVENNLSLLENHADYNRSNLRKAKIKGIDYDFLRQIAAQIMEHQTFLEDNIQALTANLTRQLGRKPKTLVFRSAPVDTVKKVISACGLHNITVDILTQQQCALEFSSIDNIDTCLAVDINGFTLESVAGVIEPLRAESYDLCLVPLNSWDYQTYTQILSIADRIGIENIWGICMDNQLLNLKKALA